MAITFKEIKQYASRIARASICFENGSYDNYTLISDISEGKYEDLFVYGIGIEVNPKEADRFVDRFKDLDIALARRMVIVLSKTPRQDIMD